MKNIQDYAILTQNNELHLLPKIYQILIDDNQKIHRSLENFSYYTAEVYIGIPRGGEKIWQGISTYSHSIRTVVSPSEFIKLFGTKAQQINQTTEMEVFKTKIVKINGVDRKVTVAVTVTEGKVGAGYSIVHKDDKFNETIGKTVAKGRALNDRSNLVDMTMGSGFDKKYILYAIADHIFRQLENGKILIKGIK